jgi:hypothetical protein
LCVCEGRAWSIYCLENSDVSRGIVRGASDLCGSIPSLPAMASRADLTHPQPVCRALFKEQVCACARVWREKVREGEHGQCIVRKKRGKLCELQHRASTTPSLPAMASRADLSHPQPVSRGMMQKCRGLLKGTTTFYL